MAERRSLGDALSPDKIAFIQGDRTEKGTALPAKQPAPAQKTIGLTDAAEEVTATDIRSPRRMTRSRIAKEEPQASEVLDRMLVPVTLRLQHRTSQALKRAALEQKLKHQKPDQVQEIREEAISKWLTSNGYLD